MKQIGRNQPCWCGSQKKYKHCHLKLDQEESLAKPIISVHILRGWFNPDILAKTPKNAEPFFFFNEPTNKLNLFREGFFYEHRRN